MKQTSIQLPASSFAEAVAYLTSRAGARRPRIGIVLGSGLGAFADELSDRLAVSYADIPNWPVSTAIGHAGRLGFGNLDNLEIVAMAGPAPFLQGHFPPPIP